MNGIRVKLRELLAIVYGTGVVVGWFARYASDDNPLVWLFVVVVAALLFWVVYELVWASS